MRVFGVFMLLTSFSFSHADVLNYSDFIAYSRCDEVYGLRHLKLNRYDWMVTKITYGYKAIGGYLFKGNGKTPSKYHWLTIFVGRDGKIGRLYIWTKTKTRSDHIRNWFERKDIEGLCVYVKGLTAGGLHGFEASMLPKDSHDNRKFFFVKTQ